MNSNTKKWIASFAALGILVYHLWIPVFPYRTIPGQAERFLITSAYIGVDLFFFLSAFSLTARPVRDYRSFLKNRALKLLPLFFIAWITGHFLWFLPSIMILYLALPPLLRVCRKRPLLSFVLLMAGWAGIVYLLLGVIQPAADLGIFLFRIPVIILGAYAVKFQKQLLSPHALPAGLLLLFIGTGLIYRYGYLTRVNTPFRGTFYLTGIPAVLGIVLIFSYFTSERDLVQTEQVFRIIGGLNRTRQSSRMIGNLNHPRWVPRMIGFLGSITLELYFAQMVFGAALISWFFRLTGSRLLTNLLAAAAVLLAAAVISRGSILAAEFGKNIRKSSAEERQILLLKQKKNI